MSLTSLKADIALLLPALLGLLSFFGVHPDAATVNADLLAVVNGLLVIVPAVLAVYRQIRLEHIHSAVPVVPVAPAPLAVK